MARERRANNDGTTSLYDPKIKKIFAAAIKLYTLAIDNPPEDKHDQSILYGNRCQAYISLADWHHSTVADENQREIIDLALIDGKKSIELDPKWSKGYYKTA